MFIHCQQTLIIPTVLPPQALSQLLELYDTQHWLYASALTNLAVLYEEQGQLDEARRLLEQALEIRR